MSENYYEGMFLLDSGKFASDPDGTTKTVLDLIEKSGGTVVAHRPWQDGRLAYMIEGQRKGLHYLTYFRMSGEGLKDVNRAVKLNDVTLRHLVIKHPQKLFDAGAEALNGQQAQAEGAEAKEQTAEKPVDSTETAEKPAEGSGPIDESDS